MRSDDDGFASRQVAAALLLRNTSLATPVPYFTETWDVSKFASVAFYLEPSGATVSPCYATIYWASDRQFSNTIATERIVWHRLPTVRQWQAQVPVRSDFMRISFDAGGAGSLNMTVTGSSRSVPAITQQAPPNIGGTPRLLLDDTQNGVAGGAVGAIVSTPPWFGDVDIEIYSASGGANCKISRLGLLAGVDYLTVNIDESATALIGNYRRLRLSMNGHQLTFQPGAGAIATNFRIWVTPVYQAS